MRYYEIEATCYLKRDINFKESFLAISRYISFCMFQNDKLKKVHNKNSLKYYTFSSFIKLDNRVPKSGIYKKDNIYKFTIRSLNEEFVDIMQNALRENINNPYFLVTITKKRFKNSYFIKEIYSITPVISSVANGKFWTFQESGDIIKLLKLLHNNIEKKYNSFYKDRVKSDNSFIQQIEILNRKPLTIEFVKNGKKLRFFGNKFKIITQEDEISQKLAFTALGAGLGEKGSYGGGFCFGK